MKLTVISPTLNEAENVPRLVEQLEQALGDIDYEILIVDDDSPDQTWSIAQKISLTNPRVRVLRRTRNRGLGMAVIDGFSTAEGDALACIDADLQHDPSILPRMLKELLSGTDVVVGSRYIEGGSAGKWNRLRRLESWFATKTAQFLLGIKANYFAYNNNSDWHHDGEVSLYNAYVNLALSNVSVKAEYLYVNLGDFNCGLNCGLAPSGSVSFDANIFRAGLNVHF